MTRVALAGFTLEAVTFLPEPTGMDRFERTAMRGADLVARCRGTSGTLAGAIEVGDAENVELVGLVIVEGGDMGSATPDAYERYLAEIADGVLAERPDGLLLHLHGAMVTLDGRTDYEFMRDLRDRIGPDLPVVLALDLHGNLNPEMAKLVDAIVGYHQSPHIDMVETGARAMRWLLGRLRGTLSPHVAMKKAAVVLPSIFTATAIEPLAGIMSAARAMEAASPTLLDISVFTGFAYSDTPMIGFTIVAVSDGDPEAAETAATILAERVWNERHSLYKRSEVLSVPEAIAHVQAAPRTGKPIVLLEHADRGEDSTYLLRAVLALTGLRVMVPYLLDPSAAEQAASAGAGSTVTLAVGGRSSTRAGGPVELTGRVKWAGPKTYTGTGPMRRGRQINLGIVALIEIGNVTLSIISRSAAAIDLDPLIQFGLTPDMFDVIVLRSKTHFRAVYQPLAEEIVLVDTPDWGPADLSTLPYRFVRPGVFPIS